jgi:hypothetical protein
MKPEIVQSTKEVGVATITVGSGVMAYLGHISIILGIFATLTGGVLSLILMGKALNDLKTGRLQRKLIQEQRTEIKERRAKGLDLRRKGDD